MLFTTNRIPSLDAFIKYLYPCHWVCATENNLKDCEILIKNSFYIYLKPFKKTTDDS